MFHGILESDPSFLDFRTNNLRVINRKKLNKNFKRKIWSLKEIASSCSEGEEVKEREQLFRNVGVTAGEGKIHLPLRTSEWKEAGKGGESQHNSVDLVSWRLRRAYLKRSIPFSVAASKGGYCRVKMFCVVSLVEVHICLNSFWWFSSSMWGLM